MGSHARPPPGNAIPLDLRLEDHSLWFRGRPCVSLSGWGKGDLAHGTARETRRVSRAVSLMSLSFSTQSLQNIYDVLKWVFAVFPQFCLGQGLIELCYNQLKYDLTHSFGVDSYVSPFEMNFLGWTFVQLASQGTVLLILRVLLHWDLLQRPRYVPWGSAWEGTNL